MRICELRQKEVINVRDCQRIGFVMDVEFDPCTGADLSVDYSGTGKMVRTFRQRYRIYHRLEMCPADRNRYCSGRCLHGRDCPSL